MRIGVPREVKVHEKPCGPYAGFGRGNSSPPALTSWCRRGPAPGSGSPMTTTAVPEREIGFGFRKAFAADLVVKVKEPLLHECERLRPGQVLFTYLHLAADRPQALALMESGATGHRLRGRSPGAGGALPLLTPMSEVAGRMSIQVGAFALQNANGGRGVLLGGVPGVAPARVVIVGGGVCRRQCGGPWRSACRADVGPFSTSP